MLFFLSATLTIIIISAVIYIIKENNEHETPTGTEAKTGEENDSSYEPETESKVWKPAKAESSKPVFEIIRELPRTLEPYVQNWRKKISDEQLLLSLIDCKTKVENLSSNLVYDEKQQPIAEFQPLTACYFWSFDQQLQLISEDFSREINNLISEPEAIFRIHAKVSALNRFQENLSRLFTEYQNLDENLLQKGDFSKLVLNEVKILSDKEAGATQINLFLRYYYSIQIFRSFEPVTEQRIEELNALIQKTCQVLDAAKSYYIITDHQILQKNQRIILEKLRYLSAFFHHFYSGTIPLTESFAESTLIPIEENINVFLEIQRSAEEELLPLCEKYLPPTGSDETNFNREFKKVYQNFNPKSRKNILPLNAAESLKSFLQSRIKEIKQLMNPEELKPAQVIIENIYRSLIKNQ
jgi:hypothetical protein